MTEESIKNLLYKLRHTKDVNMTFPQMFKYLSDNSEGYLQELFWLLEEKSHDILPIRDVIEDYYDQKDDLDMCDATIRIMSKDLQGTCETLLDNLGRLNYIKTSQIKILEKQLTGNA